jgi:hypothetical protein
MRAAEAAGLKYITELPPDEPLVAMTTFRGMLLVATTKGLYRLHPKAKTLEPIRFVAPEPTATPP